MIPLSFGIPLGLLVMVAGAILFFSTKHQKAARLVMMVGFVITAFVLFLMVLVVNSGM